MRKFTEVKMPPLCPTTLNHDAVTSSTGDIRALAAARKGQEAAFLVLVARYHCSMIHLAQTLVQSRAIAEEVAREAWLNVLRSSATQQGRSSVKCWLFQILIDCARLRAARQTSLVSSSTSPTGNEASAESPSAETFFDDSHPIWPGCWLQSPQPWLDEQLETAEARQQMLEALRILPAAQLGVVMLRDVEGWTSAEVCETMQLSAVEQRGLLHRARTTVRARLAAHFQVASR
jgi:RNA polymerase sigma-70 factor (ECF subfamily)